MLAEIQKDARTRMTKSLDALRHELAKIRTGRAHPSLLEHVLVDYYGSEVPVGQAASVAVEDARTLSVTPWDKNMVKLIEKAMLKFRFLFVIVPGKQAKRINTVIIPFVILQLIGLIIMVVFPGLITWLPSIFFGG